MENMSKYDAILVCNYEDMINEWDDRAYTSTAVDGTDYRRQTSWDWDDPKLYAQNAFGRLLQMDLNNWRTGYSARVTDFGKWVTVDVTHHNFLTGRSASKTFLVVFNGGKIPFQGTPREVFCHGQELEDMGLGVPQMTRVFNRLRAMGMDIDPSVYTTEQAKKAILEKLGKGAK